MNRHGYLPFVFFSPSFASIDLGSLLKSGIEFRCGDVTLLWDRPIGVLYDVYAEVGKPLSVSVCSYSKKHVFPFHPVFPSPCPIITWESARSALCIV